MDTLTTIIVSVLSSSVLTTIVNQLINRRTNRLSFEGEFLDKIHKKVKELVAEQLESNDKLATAQTDLSNLDLQLRLEKEKRADAEKEKREFMEEVKQLRDEISTMKAENNLASQLFPLIKALTEHFGISGKP